jgi:hypothetical protein
MNPSERGYIIAGTHVYSLGGEIGPHVKVFVATADAVIASRLEGRLVTEEEKEQVIRKHLRENLTPLRGLHRDAALVIDGSWPHEAQVAALKEYLQRKE